MFIFLPEGRPNYDKFCFYGQLFDAADCDAIEQLALSIPEEQAVTGNDGATSTNEAIRKSVVRWIPLSERSDWLFRRLMAVVQDANRARFGFDLMGFLEPLQHTRYRADQTEHYDWHEDMGPAEMAKRKLSVVVQLSEPEEYEGGEVQFFNMERAAPKTRGTVIVFPSYVAHRVTPVTKGERRSLVAWTSGPPFR